MRGALGDGAAGGGVQAISATSPTATSVMGLRRGVPTPSTPVLLGAARPRVSVCGTDAAAGEERERSSGLRQVKTPEESKYPWDYYKIIRTIPAAEAFEAPDTACPLVKK